MATLTGSLEELTRYAREIARLSREASYEAANIPTALKNKILKQTAAKFRAQKKFLV